MPAKRSAYRIAVTAMSSHGHINACHGLVEELRDRGHEIVFLLDKAFAGRLEKYGFKEYILEPPVGDADGYDENEEFWPQYMEKNGHRYAKPPIEQLGDTTLEALTIMWDGQKKQEAQYQKALDELKPSLLLHDGYICFGTVANSGIPWIWLYSASANGILNDPRIPPAFSGLPIEGAEQEWEAFRKETARVIGPLQAKVNEYNLAEGGQDLKGQLHPYSDFLNLYMQPQELRYSGIEIPENIVGVDCFVRTVPDQTFEIPEQLKNKPGKLIFFSLGSFSSANRALMTRLLNILAKSPHRFIVSKGPLKYDLPGDNLWGEKFLPQTAILPIVDLVITHGGNNTVTETFYYGKPMLVMPVFGDQLDNAQRITETGLGDKANPYYCTEEELLGKIEKLVTNEELAKKMEQIGKRIRASTDKQRVADLIESKLAARQ